MSGSEEMLSQLTSSAVVVYAIELVKKSAIFPWLTAETKTLNRWLAVIGSGIAAIGVHFAYDAKDGALVITGLTLGAVAHGLWHWAQQYALTQLAYDSAVNNKYVPKPGDNSITKQPAPADLGSVDPKRFLIT